MRVWSTSTFFRGWSGRSSQMHAVVAAKSKRQAAEALGLSMYAFNLHASETGNDEDIAQALTDPGAVFYSPLDMQRPREWRRDNPARGIPEDDQSERTD